MKKFVLIVAVVAFYATANAQFNLDKDYEIKNTSGYVLDVAGGGEDNGTNVQLWTANGSAAQTWKLIEAPDNLFYILNPKSGKFLDVNRANFSRGTNIHIWQTNCGVAQKFKIIPAKDGYFFIKAFEGELYLTPQYSNVTEGTNLVLWDKNNLSKWLLNAK